jgi:hypothetical protein
VKFVQNSAGRTHTTLRMIYENMDTLDGAEKDVCPTRKLDARLSHYFGYLSLRFGDALRGGEWKTLGFIPVSSEHKISGQRKRSFGDDEADDEVGA